MRKRTFIVGAVALLAVGALFASNMGFKINYQLLSGTNAGSANGTNSLALPYNAQTGITDAATLYNDIGSAVVNNIQMYVESNNGIDVYPGVNFSITPGEGYFVNVGTDTDYIVVGSHDPSLSISLEPGTDPNSANGTSFIAYPYHSTATTASQLYNEIGSSIVNNIQTYVKSNNGIDVYPGVDFSLAPGEAYFVNMSAAKTWTPSHY